MNGCGRGFDERPAAVALLRWGLALLWLVNGISKLAGLGGFVNGYLVPAFAGTFLPGPLVAAYGYALPFVETLLGALLLPGLFRNTALLLGGLTLLSLAFGQLLLKQHAAVFQILVYLFLHSVTLFLADQDRWAVRRRG